MSLLRTRFAPSPTGSMHIGNARTAAFAWLLARHHGGQFILRIEDTDRTRYVEGSVEEIQDGLKWLGLDWDEGPYFQSQRLEIYRELAEQLVREGKAYRCWCSPERLAQMREEQKAAGLPTGYDRRCRAGETRHTAEEPHVIRFAMPLDGVTEFHDHVRGTLSFENALIDDFVMLKADGFPTYQFANVVDDHLMGITHVVRSDEWLSSTPKHVQLYAAFGWEPPQFVHPALILGPDRSKLSKRHGAVSFREFTQMGYLPDALLNFLALLGWSPGDNREVMTRQELIEAFDIPGIVNHPAIFDRQKLDWLNRQHIRMLPDGDLARRVKPLLEEKGLGGLQDGYLESVVRVMKDRLTFLHDIVDLASYFFTDEFEYEEKGAKWLRDPGAAQFLEGIADALKDCEWSEAAIEARVREAGEKLGREGGSLIHPIRYACTGKTVGPSLFAALETLGRDRVVRRLRRAADVARVQ
ncbi:MAG: glutamate--tRNA ligase [Armatimonadota bacterium]|nr:MAG: glutamate--tRNA ligase [Armatimonadota bacterium]